MIRAMVFDLDGTLVKTERLKAISYARAAIELRPEIPLPDVIEAFKEVVGRSRQGVAQTLLHKFDLADAARTRMAEMKASTPWEAYVALRLKFYGEMLADPAVILDNQWAHTMTLLDAARLTHCKTALATMSYRQQASRILRILDLENAFDFVATRDDVKHSKPNPEIYNLVLQNLNLSPQECLVIEDSPAGVQAALAAKMHVIAVSTPFTKERLHQANILPDKYIIDQPEFLPQAIAQLVKGQSSVN